MTFWIVFPFPRFGTWLFGLTLSSNYFYSLSCSLSILEILASLILSRDLLIFKFNLRCSTIVFFDSLHVLSDFLSQAIVIFESLASSVILHQILIGIPVVTGYNTSEHSKTSRCAIIMDTALDLRHFRSLSLLP